MVRVTALQSLLNRVKRLVDSYIPGKRNHKRGHIERKDYAITSIKLASKRPKTTYFILAQSAS